MYIATTTSLHQLASINYGIIILTFTDTKSNIVPRFKQYVKEKGFQLKDLTHMSMGIVLTVPADSSSKLVIV